jgi:hypothetical protein
MTTYRRSGTLSARTPWTPSSTPLISRDILTKEIDWDLTFTVT